MLDQMEVTRALETCEDIYRVAVKRTMTARMPTRDSSPRNRGASASPLSMLRMTGFIFYSKELNAIDIDRFLGGIVVKAKPRISEPDREGAPV